MWHWVTNILPSACTQAAELDDLRGHKLVFAKTGVSSMDRKDDVDDLVVRALTLPVCLVLTWMVAVSVPLGLALYVCFSSYRCDLSGCHQQCSMRVLT